MKNELIPQENLPVQKFDPATIYHNAGMLNLTPEERKALSAPFDDLNYEIRPDGHIYLPQVFGVQRLNEVVGIGNWSLILLERGSEEVDQDKVRIYYDGALIIRGCFVSRATGENQYSKKNAQQSFGSALEAAKSDCRQRCCKDIGIANDAWNPTFIRDWQNKYAIRVAVIKEMWNNGSMREKIVPMWRRKDLPQLDRETGIWKEQENKSTNETKQPVNEFPWLNNGHEFDLAIKKLQTGQLTVSELLKQYKVSKNNLKLIFHHLVKSCADMVQVTKLYTDNKELVEANTEIKSIFSQRREQLKKAIA
jgi:hypothetical protein